MDDLLSDIDRIVEYRELLSAGISYLLRRFGSEATAEDITQMILEHDETMSPSECLANLIMLFNASENDLDSLLPVVQEAWNYFPHRSLHGRCPAEVMTGVALPRNPRRRKTIEF
jgi:hypothetical protein